MENIILVQNHTIFKNRFAEYVRYARCCLPEIVKRE